MEPPRQLLVGQGVAGAAAVDLDAGLEFLARAGGYALRQSAPRCLEAEPMQRKPLRVGSHDRWPHPTELRIGVPSPGCAWCPGLRDRPALRCGARSRIGVAIPPPLCEGARERLPGAPADECSCGVATAPRRRRVRRRVPRGHVHWTRSTRVHPGAAGAAVAPDSRFEHGRM